jgi:hypothetical protein
MQLIPLGRIMPNERFLGGVGYILAYDATLDIRRITSHITVHTDVTLRKRTLEHT